MELQALIEKARAAGWTITQVVSEGFHTATMPDGSPCILKTDAFETPVLHDAALYLLLSTKLDE